MGWDRLRRLVGTRGTRGSERLGEVFCPELYARRRVNGIRGGCENSFEELINAADEALQVACLRKREDFRVIGCSGVGF